MTTTVEWCRICDDFYSDSQMDVHKHIMRDHTLAERLAAMTETGAQPEYTQK